MPSSTQIDLQDQTALEPLEIERVREITGEKSYTYITSLCSSLVAVQLQAMRADIVAWDAVKDGTVALKGGRDGVDFSQVRNREDIRVRVRLRLGLDAFNPLLNPNAMSLNWIETAAGTTELTDEFGG